MLVIYLSLFTTGWALPCQQLFIIFLVLWSSHFFLSEVRLVNFVFGPSSEHLRRVWSKVRPFMQIHVCCSVAKSCPTLCVIPWTAAHQASRSFHISQSLIKLMSTESVIPPTHLIRGWHHLLLSSIFPIFSKESALHIRWPKYWSFSISLSNEYWVDFL